MAGTPFGPGSVLAGRFSLDDLLDENDGARFWRATDLTLARSVAVHVLADTDSRAHTLLTAARTSALVSDGHLLRVLDAAEEDGVVYVVNEWGSGISLDRLLVEGPLSPRRAAWVVKEVAEAIATAHRNGVAHGRLLPENVMISEAGSVKLIGFVIDAVLRSDAGHGQRRVTGGAPMSAHESDVVNLAGLLYAALVGRWPGSEGSTMQPAPHEHGRPLRPRRVRAGVPRPLDAICERVLNAEAHPQIPPIETAHEVFAALSDYIGDPGAAPTLGDLEPEHHEPTTVLERGDLPRSTTSAAGDEATVAVAAPGERGDDTSDLPATGALSAVAQADGHAPDAPDQPAEPAEPEEPDELEEPEGPVAGDPGPAVRRPADADPEATQAGTPAFFEPHAGDARSLHADGTDPAYARSSAPPPPPFPEMPERPLFADGPSAAAVAGFSSRYQDGAEDTGAGEPSPPASFGHWRTTGHGTGSVPPVWGPDADEPPPGSDDWDDDGTVPGRSWLRLAVVLAVVLLIVVGAVVFLNLGSGSREDPSSAQSGKGERSPSASASRSVEVPISGVSDFDPQGDPAEENPDLVPLAVDGDKATAWQTLTYRGNPKLGGLKSGVGLLVDLGKPTAVGEVRLTLVGKPTSLELLAAPDATTAPTSTDGLTTVASQEGAGADLDLELKKPVKTQWLVVWLTSLPPVPGGFKGQVAEITVRS